MKTIKLNGIWDFVADLDPKYHLDKRIYHKDEYAIPELNRHHWLKVEVPGVWQKYAERYDIYEGVCWFSKNFNISQWSTSSSARIRFGGVNYLCHIFINGEKVGSHETGYTEFVLDVTEHLRQGDNHIAVMVDNRALITKWPPCLGYFNYGGIHRDVTIEIMDSASLDDIAIAAIPEPNGGVLNINGVVKQATAEMSVNISCAGATKTVNVAPDGSFNLNMQIVDVNHWHPESPYLYPLKINLLKDQQVIDEVEEECGFRSMKVVDNQIILNDEIFKINGICYVYDSPTRGLIMTDAQIECDIALIKEMNCTMIRCHYPMSRKFYQACDRAGIMLWIEPNIYCMHPNDDEVGTAFADPEHCRLAKQMIIEMIANARNHPSVVFYGIGNECNTTNPEADKFFRMLTDTIRLHDSSRLVSYAALYGKIGNLADIVDVLGINSYWGWYDKCFGGKGLEPEEHYKKVDTTIMREPIDLTEMRKMLDTVIDKAHENTALLLTEFGADSVPGNLSNSRNLWSENYHADLLTEVLLLAEEYPQIVGTFPFCFSDYRDPSKLVNGYWNEINLKGVVDYNRNKKLAFSAMKSAYSKKVLDAKIQELPIELFSESR